MESTPDIKNNEQTLERNDLKQFEVNIEGFWDSTSRNEMFVSKIKELPFYNPDLLYSGFVDGDALESGKIYCGTEKELESTGTDNPLEYAFTEPESFKLPKVAVYDPTKMTPTGITYQYSINDSGALIALIKVID
jgi:hypothetical protein